MNFDIQSSKYFELCQDPQEPWRAESLKDFFKITKRNLTKGTLNSQFASEHVETHDENDASGRIFDQITDKVD